jgi:hypothetical protein
VVLNINNQNINLLYGTPPATKLELPHTFQPVKLGTTNHNHRFPAVLLNITTDTDPLFIILQLYIKHAFFISVKLKFFRMCYDVVIIQAKPQLPP